MSETTTAIELDESVKIERLEDEEAGVEEYAAIELPEAVEVDFGEAVNGNNLTVEAQNFVVFTISKETSEMEQAMGAPEEVNMTAVVLSNEEDELGAAVVELEDEADLDAGIAEFEATVLDE